MKEGTAKHLEQYATWLEREWPSAGARCVKVWTSCSRSTALGLPSELRRCLGDNEHHRQRTRGAVRDRVRRVKNWQSGSMALRWTAVAFDAISQGFRRIMGYKHLWMLKAAPGRTVQGSISCRASQSGIRSYRSGTRHSDLPLSWGHFPEPNLAWDGSHVIVITPDAERMAVACGFFKCPRPGTFSVRPMTRPLTDICLRFVGFARSIRR